MTISKVVLYIFLLSGSSDCEESESSQSDVDVNDPQLSDDPASQFDSPCGSSSKHHRPDSPACVDQSVAGNQDGDIDLDVYMLVIIIQVVTSRNHQLRMCYHQRCHYLDYYY